MYGIGSFPCYVWHELIGFFDRVIWVAFPVDMSDGYTTCHNKEPGEMPGSVLPRSIELTLFELLLGFLGLLAALLSVQDALADAIGLRCDFQQLIVRKVLDRLIQAHLSRRR